MTPDPAKTGESSAKSDLDASADRTDRTRRYRSLGVVAWALPVCGWILLALWGAVPLLGGTDEAIRESPEFAAAVASARKALTARASSLVARLTEDHHAPQLTPQASAGDRERSSNASLAGVAGSTLSPDRFKVVAEPTFLLRASGDYTLSAPMLPPGSDRDAVLAFASSLSKADALAGTDADLLGTTRLEVRADSAALMIAALLLLVFLGRAATALSVFAPQGVRYGEGRAPRWADFSAIQPSEIFARDLDDARVIESNFFRRSSVMLLSGIGAACAGVLVFHLSVSEASTTILAPGDSPASGASGLQATNLDWLRIGRATALLVFLEAIAWFLLRQYRVLIEDFKEVRSDYVRRLTLALLHKYADSRLIPDVGTTFITALVRDSHRVILKHGEITPSLAAVDRVDPNFVEALSSRLAEALRSPPSG